VASKALPPSAKIRAPSWDTAVWLELTAPWVPSAALR